MSRPLLAIDDVGKSFFGVPVLQNITLSLQQGQILGLIGENGAGKSTLMNILGGVLQADRGSIRLEGSDYAPQSPREAARCGIALIHQELNLFPNLTIAENIFIDGFPRLKGLPFIHRQAINERTKEVLAAVDLAVAPETLVEKLPPGERQLVEIARALHSEAKVMIFDEPTTSLTARETRHLFALIERLREAGTAIIYISHVLEDVHRVSDEIAVLRDGKLVMCEAKAHFTTNRMISLMVGRNLEQLYPVRVSAPSAEVVLEVQGLSQEGVVENIHLTLHKGEIMGLFGLMGSGRTELAQMLFGLDRFKEGSIRVGKAPLRHHSPRESIRRKMAFVTENRREEGLLMESSVAENISLVALPHFAYPPFQLLQRRRLQEQVNRLATQLQIKSYSLKKQAARNLSGGNQQKVVLGKWLLTEPKLFFLDEPTRGVDVGAKYEIYTIINTLADQGAAILFISSELEELMGLCNRIVVMRNGEIQASFPRQHFDQESLLQAAFGEVNGHE
jgi:ribose transport system ATP-binding protein